MFEIFVGIDQTGATNSRGFPRPLHCSLIDVRARGAKFFTGIPLTSLTQSEVLKILDRHLTPVKRERVLICVDSVLGLPSELNVSPAKILRLVGDYSHVGKSYGAVTAYHFFDQFLAKGMRDRLPVREAEKKLQANSVFNLKPFQRNIGCGSYRVLKDLAQTPRWFSIWPFDHADSQFVIAEGYPSHFWKLLLQSRTRDLEVVRRKFPKLKFANLDQADSFMLAYGAWKSADQIDGLKRTKKMRLEGWILGLD